MRPTTERPEKKRQTDIATHTQFIFNQLPAARRIPRFPSVRITDILQCEIYE